MAQPAYLNINTNVVAYGDVVLTNNPLRKHFDWTRNQNSISVSNPKSEQFSIPARQMLSLYTGVRPTTLDGTTLFSISFMSGNRYRVAYTGNTDPGLAIDVPLSFTTTDFSVVVNANQTITISRTGGAAAPFSGIAAGQTVYIYGTINDGAGTYKFSAINAGYWTVLTASSTVITLSRPSGTSFSGVAETVTSANASGNMIAFAPSVIQVGDTLRLDTAAWAVDTRDTYIVTGVTSKWVEFNSSTPLAAQTNVAPGTTGFVAYSSAKRYLRIEVDQSALVYINGATDNGQQIDPWTPGDASAMGWNERVGPVWSVQVYNRSSTAMVCNLFSCE